MNEEIAQEEEEVIVEGEIVEVEIPEEKPSGKIADLALTEESDKVIVDVSGEPEEKSAEELEDYSEKVKKRIGNLTRKLREEAKNLRMSMQKELEKKTSI